MLIIGRETMDRLMSFSASMADPNKKAGCIADLEDLIVMKESHLARAEWGSCCGNVAHLAAQIDTELTMLRAVLGSLMSGDSAKASSMFDDYIALVRRNYQPEQDRW